MIPRPETISQALHHDAGRHDDPMPEYLMFFELVWSRCQCGDELCTLGWSLAFEHIERHKLVCPMKPGVPEP